MGIKINNVKIDGCKGTAVNIQGNVEHVDVTVDGKRTTETDVNNLVIKGNGKEKEESE